jgi:branched-chain amino acid transport system substrate-binding protein
MLLAGLLAVGGCGETVVRIGFLADLSGRGSGTGIAARNGAILAVDALNADGGIRGKQVVLHIKDDRGTAETAVVVDRELVGEDVALAIGHLNSGAGLAGLPVLLDAGIPVISPAMGTEKLTGLADGFFRLVPESTGQGVVLAKEMIRGTASDARVAVLLEENNLAYGEAVAGGFLPLWRQSGRTVAVEARYQTGDMAMLGQVVDTLLQSEAEAYLIIGGGLDLAVFSQKIRRQVPNACIASGMWAMTTDFLRNAGKAGDGVLFPQLFSPRSETPEWLSFVKSYRDRFGEDPLFSSGTAYEAVMVAATAMRQVKTLSMETIHAALLAASPYAGLQEDIAFDAHGDCNRTYRVVTVQDGAFVEVLP